MSHEEIAPEVRAFVSLAELRGVQAHLGELRRREVEGTAFWEAVEDFVRRGAATGVLLDSEEERWSVQGLLDYWAATLERAGRSRSDSSLVEFDPEQAPELPDAACPYLGLNAFQEQDSAIFFGRDALVEKLVQHLGAHRLVALVGPSGCGKSSLAFAGLLRRLRQGALPGSEAWRILPPMVPGAAPRAALATLLGDHARGNVVPDVPATSDAAPVLVIVIDQFEELFTLCESEAERAGFVDDLLSLVTSASPSHRLVLTVRSDFESFVARYPALYERYAVGRVAVTPPSAAELRQAIEGPAGLVCLKFEAGVIDRLLQELLGEPAGLPLLQFTLLRLWEERRRNRVTAECYERVGGGRQALARRADAIYDAMIPQDQETARRLFLLVGLAIDDKHELTRTRVPRPWFFDGGEDPGRVERVLDRLIQARLLRQTVSRQAAEPQVEVAHEALVRNWPRLAEWLQEAQTSLAERRRLEAKAKEWVRLGRGRSALLDEVELREVERWLSSATGIGLRASGDLLGLITSSQQRVESTARRHRWTIAGLAAIATALLAMLVISVSQYRIAQHENNQAKRLATETTRLLGMANLEQGRALLLDGGFTRPMSALPYFVAARKAGIETPTLRMLVAQASRNTPLVILIGHGSAVGRATFSRDGTRLVTASADHTARVWDATMGKPVTAPLEHQDTVMAAAFSPDGTRVVTASADHTARVWDATMGKPVTAPLEHQDGVWAAAFSPDGTRVVTASWDKTARVWDATTGKPVTASLEHKDGVWAAAFSPDGTRVVTASIDKTARVWDATTGKPVTAPLQHQDIVWTAAFSPDGRRVVTASADRTARVWDVTTGKPVTASLEHQGAVNAAAFSPDGTRVVTASDDQTAQVWDAATGKPVTGPLKHQGVVRAAAFSPDGTRVVTASWDKTALVWDATMGKPVTPPLEHQGEVNAAAFSSDGTRVVTASNDGTARVWDATTGKLVTVPLEHQGYVHAAAFSPDGTRVVTASTDRTARVWDATTGKPMTASLEHQGAVRAAAFSSDGTRVVTASHDDTARVWDATTGKLVTAPLEHQGAVNAAAFSPDGTWVVTASLDSTARVWDLPFDKGSLDDWHLVARCSPFAIIEGVLTANPDPITLCRHHRSQATE